MVRATTPLVLGLVSVLVLAGCQHYQGGPRQPGQPHAGGTILGGIAGGFLGSQFGEGSGKVVASVAGALLGAWAGNQIAQNMTRGDQVQYQQAAQQAQAAPVGEPVQWYNPETGNSGSVTATREGQTADGRYCREFQQTITIGGQTEQAYGTACRQPDGSWQIVNG